jgi:hypothetical protein
MHPVNTRDHARNHLVASVEVQAGASGLLGHAYQPVIELDALRRHSGGKQTLQGHAMKL